MLPMRRYRILKTSVLKNPFGPSIGSCVDCTVRTWLLCNRESHGHICIPASVISLVQMRAHASDCPYSGRSAGGYRMRAYCSRLPIKGLLIHGASRGTETNIEQC